VSLGGATVDGLVLCTAGEHRLAFHARDVTGIDVWAQVAEGVPYARTAWKLPPAAGRLVVQDDAAMVVDTLEISADPLPALGVPRVLEHACGGSLTGFVMARGQLWPVLTFTPFARFVEKLPVVREEERFT
jgi:hypothetical protein